MAFRNQEKGGSLTGLGCLLIIPALYLLGNVGLAIADKLVVISNYGFDAYFHEGLRMVDSKTMVLSNGDQLSGWWTFLRMGILFMFIYVVVYVFFISPFSKYFYDKNATDDCTVDVLMELTKQYGLEFCKIGEVDIPENILKLLPFDFIEEHSALPVKKERGVLTVAMSDPTDNDTLDRIRYLLQCDVEAVICPEKELKEKIETYRDELG